MEPPPCVTQSPHIMPCVGGRAGGLPPPLLPEVGMVGVGAYVGMGLGVGEECDPPPGAHQSWGGCLLPPKF